MYDLFSLKGKVVVITGGSTHLGRAMSEAVCQYGATAVICSRNADRNKQLAEQLNREYCVDSIGAYMDFTDEESVKKLIDDVLNKYKHIDVLINNAAFSRPGKIEEQAYSDFMMGLHGTVGGTFNVIKHILNPMKEQSYGSIINVSSMYGVVSPDPDIYEGTNNAPNPSNYGAGKAAIIQLTKYIACNYAKYNIRANCIVPGAFPNPAVQSDKQFTENLKKKSPIGRIGNPDDLKGITVFLSSDSSSYITGQSLLVDGGWTVW